MKPNGVKFEDPGRRQTTLTDREVRLLSKAALLREDKPVCMAQARPKGADNQTCEKSPCPGRRPLCQDLDLNRGFGCQRNGHSGILPDSELIIVVFYQYCCSEPISLMSS